MILTAHNVIHPQIGTGEIKFAAEDYESTDMFKWEETASTNYVEVENASDVETYYGQAGASYVQFRNHLIENHISLWATLPDDDKATLVRNYVWPEGTTTEELDAIYTETERETYAKASMDKLCDCAYDPKKSSSSLKFFLQEVDDDGVYSTTEINNYTTI